MDKLIVYKTEFDKGRVGRLMDGGYVINRLPGSYDILISGVFINPKESYLLIS